MLETDENIAIMAGLFKLLLAAVTVIVSVRNCVRRLQQVRGVAPPTTHRPSHRGTNRPFTHLQRHGIIQTHHIL